MSGIIAHRGLLLNGVPAVIFKASGTMLIIGSGTTVAPAVPMSAAAGDLLVAVIMRRSAVASDPPSGWTIVSNAGPSNDGASTNQWSQVYTKTATGLEAGAAITFTQTSSGRMIGQIIAISGSNGTPTLESQSTNIVSATSTNTASIPSISSSGEGRLGVAVAAFIGSTTGVTISADTGWNIRSIATTDNNRVGVFTKILSSGATTSGTVSSSISPTVTGTTSNALIFAA